MQLFLTYIQVCSHGVSFFFQAEDGIRDVAVTGVQTCALPICKEKAEASFIIPSTYRGHDGRNHATQREHGEYWMLAIDVDEGDPSLTELRTAVATVTGDASALIYSSSGASQDNRKRSEERRGGKECRSRRAAQR